MRISDWSSDVCSSDLNAAQRQCGCVIAQGDTIQRIQGITRSKCLCGCPDQSVHWCPSCRLFLYAERMSKFCLPSYFIRPACTGRSEARRVGKACVSTV